MNDRKPITNQTENAWGKTEIDEFTVYDRAIQEAKTKYMQENGTPLKEDVKPTFAAILGKALGYFLQISFVFAVVLIVVKLLTMLYFWMF